jgi:amidase
MTGNKISDLIRMTATQVVALLHENKVSALELLDELEARIEFVDPVINALPTLCFDRARDRAKKLAQQVSGRNSEIGLLAGLPVPIKDLADVSGVRTTRGSLVYKDNIPTHSNIMVKHLERQGAIIYAKSNTPEFGTGGNTRNKVFGMTRNPWNRDCSVAGSSGGAAAALASGMAWLAQGSDMGGSLRNPASFCGVVGLRPSIGRVAATLSDSVIDTLSTNGPMARNIPDIALMLDAMCGHEPLAPLSIPAPESSFRSAAAKPKLPGSIAFSYDLGITPVDPEVREIFIRALEQIESAGVALVEKTPDFSGLHDTFHVLRAQDYAAGMGGLLDDHEALMDSNTVWNIKEGLKLSTADIFRAEASRVELVARVQRFFQENEFILTPATVVPPYPVIQDHVTECNGEKFDNYYRWLSIAYAFTTALCPALVMPCGFTTNRLPVGIQIATKNYNESSLLTVAAALEEIFSIDTPAPIDPAP